MHIILFFTYKVGIRNWLESGIFKREVQLYKELVNKGYKVTFVTYDKDSYDELLRESGIIHLPLFRNINEPKSKFMYFIKSLLVVYRSHKIFGNADIFKTNQLLGSWIPIVAKLFYRKKLIVRTGYDLLEFTLKNRKSLLKIILYYLLTQVAIVTSDLYTVSSKSDKKLIQKRFFFAKEKIKVRNNWVLIPKTVDILNRFDNKLLLVGRLEKQKNFSLLIEKLKDTDYLLHIYGEGQEKDVLEKLSIKNNINSSFFGNIPNQELVNVYGNYKFFLLPSKFEGNPKVILEAMAAGCIVVASDIENHKEIVSHNINGLLVDFKEINLPNLLSELCLNKEKLQALSSSARNFILENNTLDAYLEKEISDYKF